MSFLLWLLAAALFFYWLYGLSQPLHHKPQILRGPLGDLGVLATAILLAIIGLVV